MIQNKRVLIIIPAFNEEKNIRQILTEIQDLHLPYDFLVIDDGSQDETRQRAKDSGALVVRLPFNVGIGGAVQTGFKYALKEKYDFVLRVDADGQHDVRYLAALAEPVLNDRADLTVGSRFIPPFLGYQSSFVRRIGINFFAWLISGLTHLAVTDSTSGFRAYNQKMIRLFADDYPTDFPEPEEIMMAKKAGVRFQEVPVEMRKRQQGLSSIRYLSTLYYMIKVTFAILMNTLKKKG
ncbi:MAG: glycosyltransferase family 2 protein [Candidatus Omnitrophota bacterium]